MSPDSAHSQIRQPQRGARSKKLVSGIVLAAAALAIAGVLATTPPPRKGFVAAAHAAAVPVVAGVEVIALPGTSVPEAGTVFAGKISEASEPVPTF